MKTEPLALTPTAPGPFRVAALFDGFDAALLAHDALGDLALRAHPSRPIQGALCSFAMLKGAPPPFLASRPDLILVASSSPPPTHVLLWLAHHLAPAQSPPPILQTLHHRHPTSHPPPWHREIHALAAQLRSPLPQPFPTPDSPALLPN